MPRRIAVLASGRGSNLRALLDHLALDDARAGEVVLVASDQGDAGALALARERGIEGAALDMGPAHAESLERLLAARAADLVVLAGYLRFVPDAVTRRWRGRIVNVHPALLPAFGGKGMYGMRVHRAVLAAGARVSGATVHFVDDEYDHGATIAQWPVPVFGRDTPQTLAARVLRAEHRLLPRVVRALAAGRIHLGDDGRVHGALDAPRADAAFYLAASSDDALAGAMDAALALD
jgi:formyltetrahydrofolate-dependent phosphoribosylglycinamide formyltransferase